MAETILQRSIYHIKYKLSKDNYKMIDLTYQK